VQHRPVTSLKVAAAGTEYQWVRVGHKRGAFVLARPLLKVGQHPLVSIVITGLFQLVHKVVLWPLDRANAIGGRLHAMIIRFIYASLLIRL
jgi:hypothetical protein